LRGQDLLMFDCDGVLPASASVARLAAGFVSQASRFAI